MTQSSASSAPSQGSSSASSGGKSFTKEEVAKHNKKDDCWVIIGDQVLDVTKFLPDHPGGQKAIILYAGRDATEEFNMLHDPKVRLFCSCSDTLVLWKLMPASAEFVGHSPVRS